MAVDPIDLNYTRQYNMGSIQRTVYYADLNLDIDADNFPNLPNLQSAQNFTDLAVIDKDIPLKDGRRWKELYVTEDTGAVRSEMVGEMDGKSFEHYLDFFYPGNKEEALSFAAYINNGHFLFIAKDAEGKMRLVGNPQFPAQVDSNELTTGQSTSDRKGMTVTVKAKGNSPAPIYKGNLILTAGSGS